MDDKQMEELKKMQEELKAKSGIKIPTKEELSRMKLCKPIMFVVGERSMIAGVLSPAMAAQLPPGAQAVQINVRQVVLETAADMEEFIRNVSIQQYVFPAPQVPPLVVQLFRHMMILFGLTMENAETEADTGNRNGPTGILRADTEGEGAPV